MAPSRFAIAFVAVRQFIGGLCHERKCAWRERGFSTWLFVTLGMVIWCWGAFGSASSQGGEPPGEIAKPLVGSAVEGTLPAAERELDDLVGPVMRELELPGLSIVLARGGEISFAKGYGYADVERGEPVTPRSLFRIASVSKPITAVAVMQLVERRKLRLSDRICEVLALEDEIEAAGEAFDPRWRAITIEQLLQHRGGWDRDASFDAMFRSVEFANQMGETPPAGTSTVIRAMLREPLDFEPGGRYAYSNFGYCLLGRAIEVVSGRTYEAYVRAEVLEPLGITTMGLGKTRLEQRRSGEVRYYHRGGGPSVFAVDLGESVPAPYGQWHLEAMDAHGGWLASAVDLARFGMAFDEPQNCPILGPEAIREMYARPQPAGGPEAGVGPKNGADGARSGGVERPGEVERSHDTEPEMPAVYYSLAWSNRVIGQGRINRWHAGSLPGTTSILIRRADGWTMVALVNTRQSPTEQSVGVAIDRMLHRLANRLQTHDSAGE